MKKKHYGQNKGEMVYCLNRQLNIDEIDVMEQKLLQTSKE